MRQKRFERSHPEILFNRGHVTPHPVMSVGRSVHLSIRPPQSRICKFFLDADTTPCLFGRSVRWSVKNIAKLANGFRITAPAQTSATALPCTQPCFSLLHMPKRQGCFRFLLKSCHVNAAKHMQLSYLFCAQLLWVGQNYKLIYIHTIL